jgi:hypothetical protein
MAQSLLLRDNKAIWWDPRMPAPGCGFNDIPRRVSCILSDTLDVGLNDSIDTATKDGLSEHSIHAQRCAQQGKPSEYRTI